MCLAAVRAIERAGDRAAIGENFACPLGERHFLAVPNKPQTRLASARGDGELVLGHGRELLRCIGRAVAEQAMQQEHVEEAHRVGGDPDRHERIEVHQPHLDILDAAVAQGMQRAFARPDHALGPDRAVELVLHLQQGRGELPVLAVLADADRFIRRIRFRHRFFQRCPVAPEIVVAHRERRLRIALVPQTSHAQRRRVRQVERVATQALQWVIATGDEGRAHRGRGTEEVEQQPRVPPEVADQREVLVVGAAIGQRKVVVDTGDGLHAPAVAMRQAHAIHGLHPADVGAPEAADGNRFVSRQSTGHARGPQQLIADGSEDDLVDLGQLPGAILRADLNAGDELELRLAEIGRDVRVLERGAERRRMRRRRQRPVRPHPQALFLDPAAKRLQHLARQRLQALAAMGGSYGGGEGGGHGIYCSGGGKLYTRRQGCHDAPRASLACAIGRSTWTSRLNPLFRSATPLGELHLFQERLPARVAVHEPKRRR